MSRKLRVIIFCFVVVGIALIASVVSVNRMNRKSLQFFETGKTLVAMLEEFADSVEARNPGRILEAYADDFSGLPVGLNQLEILDDVDGVQRLSMSPNPSPMNREDAVREWERYLDGFASIEEARMHVHRLEKWDSNREWIASVRFEVIGTPIGFPADGIDRAYFRMTFAPDWERPRILSSELLRGERLVSIRPHFSDVSAEAGIDFENRYYPKFLELPLKFAMIRYGPAGIATADYDNDGYYDLFIPDGVESRLYRNRGDGTFEDVTEKAGLSGLDGVSVAVFADFDNDGHKDLFVSRTFRPNQLFRNNGDGTFTDVTEKAGIGEDCCTTVASWADYNNSGYLDLYVGRYLDPRLDIPTTFYARNGEPNQLYRNNGDGTFTNVTEEAGVGETGLCLGTVFGDYNDDGWPDLYVVNDFGRNTLYRNNGDGTFTDVTVQSGTLDYGAGMNASMGDFNNNGLLDIYTTNIRSEEAWFAEAPTIHRYMYNSWAQGVWKTDMPLYLEMFRQSGFDFVKIFQQMASGNTLLKNQGDGTFQDITWEASANPIGWFWSASFADFNNNGWQDIYAANGWVYNTPGTEIELQFLNNVVSHQDQYKTGIFFDPDHFGDTSWHGWQRNRLLRNNGDDTFSEIGTPSGAGLILNSRGVAVADFWNRGVLDIAVSASTDRHALLRNEVGVGRNWLAVELEGTQSNRDAVGARVIAHVGTLQQMREVVAGDGYSSQNTLRLHFGLGEQAHVDRLEVRWPRSGIVQTFENVTGNRIVRIIEGDESLTERAPGVAP
jgi:hypothetical protein